MIEINDEESLKKENITMEFFTKELNFICIGINDALN